MRILLGALVLSAMAAPANAQTPVTVEMVLAEAASDCADFEHGVFTPGDTPVSDVDLTGDAAPDQIVNAAGFQCSTLASLSGGTGGSPITVLADGRRYDWTVLDYQVVVQDYAPPVLLLALHGSECNAIGDQPCFEALVWGGDGFLGVRPARSAD